MILIDKLITYCILTIMTNKSVDVNILGRLRPIVAFYYSPFVLIALLKAPLVLVDFYMWSPIASKSFNLQYNYFQNKSPVTCRHK